MVTGIRPHEDKRGRTGGRARESAEVSDRVARSVEEIKGAIAEEIHGVEAADLEHFLSRSTVEADFAHGAAVDIAVEDLGVRVRGPAGPGGGAHAGAEDQVRAGGEGGHVADVVEVVVGPDHRVDVFAAYVQSAAVGVERRGYVAPGRDYRGGLDDGDGFGSGVFPVRAHAEVEYDVVVVVGD